MIRYRAGAVHQNDMLSDASAALPAPAVEEGMPRSSRRSRARGRKSRRCGRRRPPAAGRAAGSCSTITPTIMIVATFSPRRKTGLNFGFPAARPVGGELPPVIGALDAARGGINSALRQRRQAVRANVSHDGPGRAVAPHCELDADDFDTNWHVADQALGRSDRQPCSVLTVICLDRFGLNTGNSGG